MRTSACFPSQLSPRSTSSPVHCASLYFTQPPSRTSPSTSLPFFTYLTSLFLPLPFLLSSVFPVERKAISASFSLHNAVLQCRCHVAPQRGPQARYTVGGGGRVDKLQKQTGRFGGDGLNAWMGPLWKNKLFFKNQIRSSTYSAPLHPNITSLISHSASVRTSS